MRYSPNASLVGVSGGAKRITTPALMVDAARLKSNIAQMMDRCREVGLGLRPHGKTHKCTRLAQMQIDAGALGICAATGREGIAFARAGLTGILITAPVVQYAQIDELARLHAEGADIRIVIDHPEVARRWEKALAALAAGAPPLPALEGIDIQVGRTGALTPEAAAEIAAHGRLLLVECADCGLRQTIPSRIDEGHVDCVRCGALLSKRTTGGVEQAIVLNLTALVIFILANVFPFITLNLQGRVQDAEIISAAYALYQDGMWELGVLVLLFAILLPLLKILGNLYVMIPLHMGFRPPAARQVFRWMEVVHRWAMMEVFLLGVIVGYVKLISLATVIFGIAAFSFVALIILVVAAETVFEPITVWERLLPSAPAATLAAIANDKGVLAGIDAVYVVDQGTDRVGEKALFQDIAARLGDKLVYLQQPNLGGSGGFTRGMYEVSSITDHANVILMDDDILCEPDAVLRLNAFANLTPTPTIVGAQMLYLKNPRYLLAGAEDPDLGRLRPGRWAPNSLHNEDITKKRQNKRTDATYTGWWTCLIPAEVIAAVGLPLPLFIKWDDIEYSLRAGAHGFPTVTLPNAAVWHAEFHWKDYDDWVHYFQIRNALVTAALRGAIDSKQAGKAFAREIAECLASMRYGLAHLVIRAIEDFLEGPSILADGGAGAAARVRAERSQFPETKTHPAVSTAELTNARPPTRPSSKHHPRKDRLDLVRTKRFVYQWFGRTIPGPVMIPASDAHWWHIALFDYAVVTDASQAGVRVLRRDKQKLKALTGRANTTLRRFRKQAPAIQDRYREAFPELSSRDNWARLFSSTPTG